MEHRSETDVAHLMHISPRRKLIVQVLVPLYIALMVGIPAAVAVTPTMLATSLPIRILLAGLAPLLFTVLYPVCCGLLARITMRAIVPGVFPRDVGNLVYAGRKLYGLCWTSMYYFSPLYNVVLSVPRLRWLVLRLFGYRGSVDVVLYPDTWIRDLPLLEIAEDVYVSNRATLGTNICLKDGRILVNKIQIGRGSLIGHLAVIAPGVRIGEHVEVGVVTAIGMNVDLGSGVRIGPGAAIHHGARIGAGADIGACSYVGVKAIIGDGIRIPNGSIIPNRAVIFTQDDASKYVSSHTVAAIFPQTGNGVISAASQSMLREMDETSHPAVAP